MVPAQNIVLYRNPNREPRRSSNTLETRHDGDVIVTSDGASHFAHKDILAAKFKFFKLLFGTSKFREAGAGVVEIKNVNSDALEAIIVYAYTDSILITSYNALDLLRTANYLVEDDNRIKEACIEFLSMHLSSEDAPQALALSEVVGSMMLRCAARRRIILNISKLSKDVAFLQLDRHDMKYLLSGRIARAKYRAALFDGLLAWLAFDAGARRKFVRELLVALEVELLPADDFVRLLGAGACRSVDDDGLFKEILIVRHSRCLTRPTAAPEDGQAQAQAQQQKQQQFLLIAQDQYSILEARYFNFDDNKWIILKDFAGTPSEECHKSAVIGNKLFYVTVAELSRQPRLAQFDLLEHSAEVLDLTSALTSDSSLCTDGKLLYWCGGGESKTFQSYDPRAKHVDKSLPPMMAERSAAAAVFYGECLVVLGGRDGPNALRTVEKYDPETKVWTAFPPMCERRRGHSVAILDKYLYACGGKDSRTLEIYDPDEQCWSLVTSMQHKRSDFLLVAREGKLYAIGGNTTFPFMNLEVYDPEEDTWTMGDGEIAAKLHMNEPIGGLVSTHASWFAKSVRR